MSMGRFEQFSDDVKIAVNSLYGLRVLQGYPAGFLFWADSIEGRAVEVYIKKGGDVYQLWDIVNRGGSLFDYEYNVGNAIDNIGDNIGNTIDNIGNTIDNIRNIGGNIGSTSEKSKNLLILGGTAVVTFYLLKKMKVL